jgi:phosphoribosyl-AMP cyclohydrolase
MLYTGIEMDELVQPAKRQRLMTTTTVPEQVPVESVATNENEATFHSEKRRRLMPKTEHSKQVQYITLIDNKEVLSLSRVAEVTHDSDDEESLASDVMLNFVMSNESSEEEEEEDDKDEDEYEFSRPAIRRKFMPKTKPSGQVDFIALLRASHNKETHEILPVVTEATEGVSHDSDDDDDDDESIVPDVDLNFVIDTDSNKEKNKENKPCFTSYKRRRLMPKTEHNGQVRYITLANNKEVVFSLAAYGVEPEQVETVTTDDDESLASDVDLNIVMDNNSNEEEEQEQVVEEQQQEEEEEEEEIPPPQPVRRSQRLASNLQAILPALVPVLRRSPRLALLPRVSYVGMC